MRRFYYIILSIFIGSSLIYSFFGKNGVLQIKRLRSQVEQIENEVREIDAKNQAMRELVTFLKSDRKTVERVAREELGMIKKDEIVIQFKKR